MWAPQARQLQFKFFLNDSMHKNTCNTCIIRSNTFSQKKKNCKGNTQERKTRKRRKKTKKLQRQPWPNHFNPNPNFFNPNPKFCPNTCTFCSYIVKGSQFSYLPTSPRKSNPQLECYENYWKGLLINKTRKCFITMSTFIAWYHQPLRLPLFNFVKKRKVYMF